MVKPEHVHLNHFNRFMESMNLSAQILEKDESHKLPEREEQADSQIRRYRATFQSMGRRIPDLEVDFANSYEIVGSPSEEAKQKSRQYVPPDTTREQMRP